MQSDVLPHWPLLYNKHKQDKDCTLGGTLAWPHSIFLMRLHGEIASEQSVGETRTETLPV